MGGFVHFHIASIVLATALFFGQSAARTGSGEVPERQTHTSPEELQKRDKSGSYFLAEAGMLMPYHVYVPMRYDGHTALPVIVMLHSRGLDENSPFVEANGLLARLADEHGYIIVCPLGFRKDAGFGQQYALVINSKNVLSDVDDRTARLSELDVMNVLQHIISEFNVDRSRIYLAGHSMGGLGAWPWVLDRAVFGSTTYRVMQLGPCPVFAVHV
jgi:predicted peptidase